MTRMLDVESTVPSMGKRPYFGAFFNMSQWKASRGWLRIQALCLKLALVIYFNAFNSFECCNNKGWVGEKKEDFEIRNKIGKMSRQR